MAEHVATLPVNEAVAALLPHMWYDPDWEYTAPAAIAMHSKRAKVLKALLCRANRSDELPGDLSLIDAGGEIRKVLARLAGESREDEWPLRLARIIGQACVELARLGVVDDLGGAVHWPTWNRHVRDALLGRLTGDVTIEEATLLADTLARLDPTPEDKRQAVGTLLRQLTGDAANRGVPQLTSTLIRLDPTPDDRRQARDALLALLAEDRGAAFTLARVLAWLDPTPDDRRQAISALLGLLAGKDTYVVDELETNVLTQIAGDKHQAREAVLRCRLTRSMAWGL